MWLEEVNVFHVMLDRETGLVAVSDGQSASSAHCQRDIIENAVNMHVHWSLRTKLHVM